MSAVPPDGGDDDTQPSTLSPREGRRKDGNPYAPGNTRADGSYGIGYQRTPEGSRFAVGDGRKRGTRPKGSKNLLTEWREELDATITVTEDGKRKRISKRRGLIKSQIDRGMKKSDRAAEISLKYAELSERREPGLQADDLEIIAFWLAGIQQHGDSADSNDPTHCDDKGDAVSELEPASDADAGDA